MTLAARSLAFGYPGRVVGRGLDLALARGEVLCVLGPNGAGKTTLFRTLLGLIPALGGRVLVAGKELADLSRAAVAREVAYVPQASAGGFDFTLLETVEMGRTAHLGALARPGRRDREVAAAALDRLGIAALAQRPLAAVSGGERQLALIARALATEANALVMDEPAANLDFGNQARVLGEIARLRDAGIAVLLCTHDPAHAFQIADSALLLARGQALAQGAAAEILTARNLSLLYGVGVHVTEVDTPAGRRRICVPAIAP
jgi:iron complex transport system ATP-binding protein